MRNSSLIERSCAENVTGLKHITEAANCNDGHRKVFGFYFFKEKEQPRSGFSRIRIYSESGDEGKPLVVPHYSGRGALISRRSHIVRCGGALSSENAGMSNHKAGENPAHRKSKVSWAMMINPGLVGPKPRR